MHGRHVNSKMVLLSEPLVAQRTGIGAMFLVDRLHVLLQVVLPLEPVRTDGADVRLCPVGLFVDGRLVRRHQMGTQMMPLQKALITKMTSKGLDLQFEFGQFLQRNIYFSYFKTVQRIFISVAAAAGNSLPPPSKPSALLNTGGRCFYVNLTLA